MLVKTSLFILVIILNEPQIYVQCSTKIYFRYDKLNSLWRRVTREALTNYEYQIVKLQFERLEKKEDQYWELADPDLEHINFDFENSISDGPSTELSKVQPFKKKLEMLDSEIKSDYKDLELKVKLIEIEARKNEMHTEF